jgi:hypothetical protein
LLVLLADSAGRRAASKTNKNNTLEGTVSTIVSAFSGEISTNETGDNKEEAS